MAHQTSVLRALSLIIYNFSFYFLYLILFSFLVITPLDLILQASDHHRKADIFVIVLGYAVTVVIITFIYAARLYIHRSVLASIPKGWVPVEKGDVPDEVRDVIAQDLGRSAAIAWEARPRVEHFKEGIRKSAHQQQPSPSMYTPNDDVSQDVNPNPATVTLHPATRPLHQLWAHIQHPGWSPPIPLPSTLDAPATPDPLLRPNLNYETVIAELPALIEAKALTLLSQTSSSSHGDGDGHEHEGVNPAMAAPLLQRPEAMTLREYLGRLVELGVLDSDAVTVTNHPDDGVDEGEDVLTSFLHRWEAARFGPRPVTAAEFKTLMRAFAGVLRAMRGVPAEELLERGFGDDDEDDEEEGVTDYEEDEDQQQGEEQPQEGSDEPEESEGNIDSDAPRGTSVSSDAAERDPQSQRELRNSGTTKSTWSRKFRRRSVSSGSTTFSSSSSVSSMDSGSSTSTQQQQPLNRHYSTLQQNKKKKQRRKRRRRSSEERYRTAPTTPRSRRTVVSQASIPSLLSLSPSATRRQGNNLPRQQQDDNDDISLRGGDSFAQTRQPYNLSSTSSSNELHVSAQDHEHDKVSASTHWTTRTGSSKTFGRSHTLPYYDPSTHRSEITNYPPSVIVTGTDIGAGPSSNTRGLVPRLGIKKSYSSLSLRSTSGSIIRLAERDEEQATGLPYVLT